MLGGKSFLFTFISHTHSGLSTTLSSPWLGRGDPKAGVKRLNETASKAPWHIPSGREYRLSRHAVSRGADFLHHACWWLAVLYLEHLHFLNLAGAITCLEKYLKGPMDV